MNTPSPDPLRVQLAIMRNSLFDEKMLDEHYRLLEHLEGGDEPNFVEETMNTFFESSAARIAIIEQALEKNPPSNFSEVERHAYQLKGSSCGVGAKKVGIETDKLIKCIEERDMERAKIVLQQIKRERDTLELRLEPYFQLWRQVEPSKKSHRSKSSVDPDK